ncbi:hypothetical protein [Marinibacterium profundimaris]|uniref:hypothetical protein n=1 Tax=Marinibacterium profundimaris TaxID=1679460 RepID=UPI00117CC16A|nr:hypothetical protein [Marinibacterium profundimaris]
MNHIDALRAARAGSGKFPSDPDAPEIDCETSMLMRSWIGPVVEQASGWPALIEALSRRGYSLAFRDGRLWLTEAGSGTDICTMRHLGASMRDLAARLGRPAVRPVPGRPNHGILKV